MSGPKQVQLTLTFADAAKGLRLERKREQERKAKNSDEHSKKISAKQKSKHKQPTRLPKQNPTQQIQARQQTRKRQRDAKKSQDKEPKKRKEINLLAKAEAKHCHDSLSGNPSVVKNFLEHLELNYSDEPWDLLRFSFLFK